MKRSCDLMRNKTSDDRLLFLVGNRVQSTLVICLICLSLVSRKGQCSCCGLGLSADADACLPSDEKQNRKMVQGRTGQAD